MNKILLVCMVVISVLGVSTTVQAQDPCQKYHDRYRVCVEKQDSGRNMDYNTCKTFTDQSSCEGAGCYWNAEKGKCIIDICLTDSTYDYENGKVNSSDLGILKNEFGRIDCPSAPFVPAPAPVAKTGQTTLYATGDDGDLEKGVEWPNPRFTILYHYPDGMINVPCEPPTVECENPPNPLNDIVIDNLTGLQWLRDAGYFPAMTWTSACTNVGFAGLIGGHDDWRVPNVRELLSLIDYSMIGPALPSGHPFMSVQVDFNPVYYWTSTTHPFTTNTAYCVDFGWNTLDQGVKDTNTNYVWPVRGGQ